MLIDKADYIPIVNSYNFNYLIVMLEKYKTEEKVSDTLKYYYRSMGDDDDRRN